MSQSHRSRRAALAVRAALALGLVLLASCASPGAVDKRILQHLNQEGFGKRYHGDAQRENYVTIGDTIQYLDLRHPEVRGTAEVDIDGTILFDQAGAVFVAGMTRAELETVLTRKLSAYYHDTAVQVAIRTGGQRSYYVWGEVAQPGRKRFVGDLTLFEAVIGAHPQESTANLGRVKLIRADPTDPLVITADVTQLWRSGDSTYNVRLKEYDIVYVPPTLLKQFADMVSAAVVPIVSPLRSILSTVFFLNNGNRFGNRRRF